MSYSDASSTTFSYVAFLQVFGETVTLETETRVIQNNGSGEHVNIEQAVNTDNNDEDIILVGGISTTFG